MPMILAGDLGGTKCNLALFEQRTGKLQLIESRRFESHAYRRVDEMVAEFVPPKTRIQAAGFGVAAPILGRTIRFTNVALTLDGNALAKRLGLPRVTLLNDMEATGYSLELLDDSAFCTLNAGEPVAQATQALIAAGTGLGEAILWWDGARRVVVPTEGGHTDFAPRTDEEIEFLRFLKNKFSPVSFEHILSGGGFQLIHEFLDPQRQHESFSDPQVDPAVEITHRGLDGSCPVCARTLDFWVSLYGAEAGNLALKSLARGGVFVAGGIAVKMLDKIRHGRFVESFCEKSKFSDLLARIPIRVVLHEDAPLWGAASRAAGQATRSARR